MSSKFLTKMQMADQYRKGTSEVLQWQLFTENGQPIYRKGTSEVLQWQLFKPVIIRGIVT